MGEALLETLAERQFPVGEIYALARNESAGEQLRFGGKTITVQDAAEFDWTQAQLAFFVAGKEATAARVEEATNSGCPRSTAADCLLSNPTYRWWCRK